jgi:hypothetical protein
MISCMTPFLAAGAEAVNFQHGQTRKTRKEFLSPMPAEPSRVQQNSSKPL